MRRLAVLLCAASLCGGLPAAGTNAVARVKVEAAAPAAAAVADVAPVPEAAPVKVVVDPVLAAEFAKATEANASEIAAAVYARLAALTVKGVEPVALAKLQAEWYERFKATPSSKAWWILRVAKERAERGESVEKLKAAFDATMAAWLAEEE